MNDIRNRQNKKEAERKEENMRGNAENAGDETGLLHYLAKMEDLAEKKCKIYSRLLIDPRLAQDMESLAVAHAQGKKTLLTLAKKEEKNA